LEKPEIQITKSNAAFPNLLKGRPNNSPMGKLISQKRATLYVRMAKNL
jgi:hypothetical protein